MTSSGTGDPDQNDATVARGPAVPRSGSREPITTGQVLAGRYRLERKLGEGGMGVVYRASDLEVEGEIFAIKVLNTEIRERSEALELLREEVRKTRLLAHPNIVGVYSLNVDPAAVFILMECLEGKTLQALLDEDFGRGMPFDRAWPIIEDVGAALAYAHDHSVIHGDLKPSNVFVTTSGKAKLFDFGIARAARGSQWGKDTTALAALTPAYASCEMLEYAVPDTRDDVYTFACVIYEVLSGRRPFGDRTAVQARDTGEKPLAIASLTDRQHAALSQGLAFNRTLRTASVESLLAGLAPGGGSGKTRVFLPGVAWIACLVLLIALALVLADRFWLTKSSKTDQTAAAVASGSQRTSSPAPAISEKSVAVLPFTDMSEKRDREYFSDGLSEELIDRLAQSADLKVIARTSSFQFKGKNEDVRTIGQKLGVANLLEGSVRMSGKTVRVTAQLVSATDGSHIWSQTFDRGMVDIFKVQDEIAGAVVTALQAKMATRKSPSSSEPANIEAYNAILRGRYFRGKQTREDSERAVASFEEAIRLDPNNAVAWEELAETYNIRFGSSWMPPAEIYASTRSAIDKALAIDPNLAAAHELLANLEWNFRNFAAAMAEDKRARELDPSLDHSDFRAFEALGSGQGEQAIRIFKNDKEHDPLDGNTLYNLAYAYFAVDRLQEAELTSRDLLAIEPGFSGAHCLVGEVLLARKQIDEASAVMNQEPDESSRPTCLADAMWKSGRQQEADTLLGEFASKYADSGAYNLATSYAMRNDKEQAFQWLNRAYENREAPISVMVKWDPLLRNLHGNPRFTALLQKLKLPEQT